MDRVGAAAIFPLFFAVWVVLGLINLIVMFGPASGRFKQSFFRVMVPLAAVLFAGFVGVMNPGALIFVIPMVILISAANLRAIRFCAKCGAYARSPNPFDRPRFCTKCGASLDQPVK
jgi:hypothetical protein